MKISINGEIVSAENATVSVLDHGLLYGDGVFEGIRVYHRMVFRLPDHMRRIATGARAIGLEIPGGIAALEEIVLATARAHGEDEAYIRLIITRGIGALGVDPSSCERPNVICIVDRVSLYPEAKRLQGVDLVTSSLRRPPADVLDPRVKSLNYLNNVLAKREARLAGADEALLLNSAGTIAEASGANIFMVFGGVLVTPPVSDGALEGITRSSVLKIAAELGIPTEVRSLGRFDLYAADEVFLTGSGARITPVGSFDYQEVRRPEGFPTMRRIADAFMDFAARNGTPFDAVTVSETGS